MLHNKSYKILQAYNNVFNSKGWPCSVEYLLLTVAHVIESSSNLGRSQLETRSNWAAWWFTHMARAPGVIGQELDWGCWWSNPIFLSLWFGKLFLKGQVSECFLHCRPYSLCQSFNFALVALRKPLITCKWMGVAVCVRKIFNFKNRLNA